MRAADGDGVPANHQRPDQRDGVAIVAGVAEDDGRDALITASDALFILGAAVGTVTCDPCLCDVDGHGSVAASDALLALKMAVGEQLELSCPPCA